MMNSDGFTWNFIRMVICLQNCVRRCMSITTAAVKIKRTRSKREKGPDWYHGKDMLGMMLYTDNFAGNMKGVKEKIPHKCYLNDYFTGKIRI